MANEIRTIFNSIPRVKKDWKEDWREDATTNTIPRNDYGGVFGEVFDFVAELTLSAIQGTEVISSGQAHTNIGFSNFVDSNAGWFGIHGTGYAGARQWMADMRIYDDPNINGVITQLTSEEGEDFKCARITLGTDEPLIFDVISFESFWSISYPVFSLPFADGEQISVEFSSQLRPQDEEFEIAFTAGVFTSEGYSFTGFDLGGYITGAAETIGTSTSDRITFFGVENFDSTDTLSGIIRTTAFTEINSMDIRVNGGSIFTFPVDPVDPGVSRFSINALENPPTITEGDSVTVRLYQA